MSNYALYVLLGTVCAAVIVFGGLIYLEYRRSHQDRDESGNDGDVRQEPRIW